MHHFLLSLFSTSIIFCDKNQIAAIDSKVFSSFSASHPAILQCVHQFKQDIYVGASNQIFVLDKDLRLKHDNQCQNFIKFIHVIDEENFLACGTYLRETRCVLWKFNVQKKAYDSWRIYTEIYVVPQALAESSAFIVFDPSMSILVSTVHSRDSSNKVDRLLKIRLSPGSYSYKQTDNSIDTINDPSYIQAFEDRESAYFLMEEKDTIDKDKSFSRIIRVCKNDDWEKPLITIIGKVTLKCALEKLRFDVIEVASSLLKNVVYDSQYGPVDIIYGLFSTPGATYKASAICAFTLQDILSTLTSDAFTDMSGGHVSMRKKGIKSWPLNCSQDVATIDRNTIAFLKDHRLMWNPVPAFFDNCPILTMNRDANYAFRFTSMAVDPQTTTIHSARYDVIFLSSAGNNRIYKFLNKARKFYSSKITCSKVGDAPLLQIVQSGNAVRHLSKIFIQDYHQQADKSIDRRLILLSEKSIASIASSYCDQATTCFGCSELMDPYCVWDTTNGICGNIDLSKPKSSQYVQNIESPADAPCPLKSQFLVFYILFTIVLLIVVTVFLVQYVRKRLSAKTTSTIALPSGEASDTTRSPNAHTTLTPTTPSKNKSKVDRPYKMGSCKSSFCSRKTSVGGKSTKKSVNLDEERASKRSKI